MFPSIPASELVDVNPNVLGTGGNPLSLNSVFLTKNRSIPIGAVQPFETADDVTDFFGAGSTEATLGDVYFLGFDNSNIKPGTLYFAQYADVDVAAYLRGGENTLTLAQVQAIKNAVVTGSIAGTTLTVTAAGTPGLTAGQVLTGTGVTAGTRVVQQLTGTTGGIGTYQVDETQTVASTAITGAYDLTVEVDGVDLSFATVNLSGATSFSNAAALLTTALVSGATVTYDSQLLAFKITSATTGADSTIAFASGAVADLLNFTEATGAILSQGADATTPGAAMDDITGVTQNWATFMTLWEPNTATKTLFAVWSNAQNQRYLYVAWDSDVLAKQSGNTTAFGPLCVAANYNGVCPVYPAADKAAFICGTAASIDFSEKNGRITFAYKGQSGLTADVTNATDAANLTANGYNFYAAYAIANDRFTFLQTGKVPGQWKWIDAFINEIQLNAQLQLAILSLMASIKSLPFNDEGYSLVRAACMDPINQALNFGSIRTGIPLSSSQAAQVNSAAGLPIAQTLTNQGFYLQILPATAQVRGLRGSPPCKLWYTDGGSIQKIDLTSTDVM